MNFFLAMRELDPTAILLAIIAGLPGTIAAISSLVNHRKLNQHDDSLTENTELTRDIQSTLRNGHQPP